MLRFTKKLLLLNVIFFILPIIGNNVFDASAQTCVGRFESNTVNVTLNATNSLPGILSQYNLQEIDNFNPSPTYYLRINDGISPCTKAAQLRADARVVLASPNYIIETFEDSGIIHWGGGPQRYKASEYGFDNQWAISSINLRPAQTQTTGAGIIVAVLDTGIDRTHPLFKQNQILQGKDFVDNDDNPDEVYIDGSKAYGHGTHVAGIIALVAPNAQILPVRVLDGNGFGTDWNLARALRYIATFSHNNTRVGVINMSLTSPDRSDVVEPILHDAVKGRVDGSPVPQLPLRIVTVAAAGNKSSNIPFYPAAESVCEFEIISVAASMPNNDLAYFSNYNSLQRCTPTDPSLPWVNLMAPGYRIVSAMARNVNNTSEGRYGTWSGTSMASPFVAGLAALLRAKFPAVKAQGVNCQMISTATASQNPNASPRINAQAAVTTLLPQCNQTD